MTSPASEPKETKPENVVELPLKEAYKNTLRVIRNLRTVLDAGLFPGGVSAAIPESQNWLRGLEEQALAKVREAEPNFEKAGTNGKTSKASDSGNSSEAAHEPDQAA